MNSQSPSEFYKNCKPRFDKLPWIIPGEGSWGEEHAVAVVMDESITNADREFILKAAAAGALKLRTSVGRHITYTFEEDALSGQKYN